MANFFCPHCELTFETTPDAELRCPRCLRRQDLIPAPSASSPERAPRRRRLLLTLLLVGLLAAFAAAFIVVFSQMSPRHGATTAAPSGPFVDPTRVDLVVRDYAKAHLGGGDPAARLSALRAHLETLRKAGTLTEFDTNLALTRDPLDAPQLVAELPGGKLPPLLGLEAGVLAVALAHAAELDAVLVEDLDAPNTVTSVKRKRFGILARLPGGAVPLVPLPYDRPAGAAGRTSEVSPKLLQALWLGLQATGLVERGDYRAATARVGEALALAPGHVGLTFLKGQIAVMGGMVQFGIEDMERALAGGEDALGRYNLGVAYVEAQSPFKAHQALRRAVEIEPTFGPAWLALAKLHLFRVTLQPEEQRADILKSAAEALEQVRKLEPLNPELDVTSAELLLAQDRPSEAIAVLDAAVRRTQAEVRPFLLLGRLLASEQRWPEVVSYMTQAAAAHKDNTEVRQLLALAYQAQGRDAEAEKTLRELIDMAPKAPGLRLQLAGILIKADREADASRLLEEEMRLDPANPTASLLFAQVLYNADNFKAARQQLDAHVLHHPQDLQALTLQYLTLGKLGEEAAATAVLQKAAGVQANGRTLVAQILVEQGLLVEAAAVLETVATEQPADENTALLLIACYQGLGRSGDVQRTLERALKAVADPQGFQRQVDQMLRELATLPSDAGEAPSPPAAGPDAAAAPAAGPVGAAPSAPAPAATPANPPAGP